MAKEHSLCDTSFFFKDFLTWTILKVFIEFVTMLLLFYVLVFWRQACGILAPQPGIKPAPPALEGEVLTTGPPGKSPIPVFLCFLVTFVA